jgi:hypothetical protein
MLSRWVERKGEVAAINQAQKLASAILLLSKRIGQDDTVAKWRGVDQVRKKVLERSMEWRYGDQFR